MTIDYRRLLRDPRWLAFRRDVLTLDRSTCADCGRQGATMHVHHKRYVAGRLPWEYGLSELETLCPGCHASEHGILPPRIGWICCGEEDLGDLDGECEVCGTSIRYVFTVYHERWGYLDVGTDCCDRMTESKTGSYLERRRKRRDRFITSPRWSDGFVRSDRFGRCEAQTCKIGGIRVFVYRGGPGYRVAMRSPDMFIDGKRQHGSEMLARAAAFDAVESGKAHELLTSVLRHGQGQYG